MNTCSTACGKCAQSSKDPLAHHHVLPGLPFSAASNAFDAVEKVGSGADFSGVTMRFCASSASRRNAADDGSTATHGVAILLLPLRGPDSPRSLATTDRSLCRFPLRTGAAEELLQLHGAALG